MITALISAAFLIVGLMAGRALPREGDDPVIFFSDQSDSGSPNWDSEAMVIARVLRPDRDLSGFQVQDCQLKRTRTSGWTQENSGPVVEALVTLANKDNRQVFVRFTHVDRNCYSVTTNDGK